MFSVNSNLSDGKSLTLLANALAVAISEKLTVNEENILGNLLTLIGASLLSIAAIDGANKSSENDSASSSESSPANSVITDIPHK